MARVYNFSAGPGVLPEPVLQEAAAEMMDYRGTGMSVMEMSHRSKPYERIIEEAEADLRTLMGIPENYKVLFLQGGASQQFAMVPMNLMQNKAADYIVTGFDHNIPSLLIASENDLHPSLIHSFGSYAMKELVRIMIPVIQCHQPCHTFHL